MLVSPTRGPRWGLMLSVKGAYSLVFHVKTPNILLFTVIEDLAVKCCNYYKKSNALQKVPSKGLKTTKFQTKEIRNYIKRLKRVLKLVVSSPLCGQIQDGDRREFSGFSF